MKWKRWILTLCFLWSIFFFSQESEAATGIYLPEVTEEEKSKIEEKVQSIIAGIDREYMSDIDIALYVHDYIVANTRYAIAEELESAMNGTELPPYLSNAAGPLVYGVAECMGYTQAYKYIMNKLGFQCHYTVSVKMNHAWNLLRIDENWYHVDCTWDDPVYGLDDGGPESVSRQFFLHSDSRAEELGYEGWDRLEECNEASHDKEWWDEVKTRFVAYKGTYYYVRDCYPDAVRHLGLVKVKDGIEEVIRIFPYAVIADEVIAEDILDEISHAVLRVKDTLYWTDGVHVYSWIPDSGAEPQILFTLEGDGETGIYSMYVSDDQAYLLYSNVFYDALVDAITEDAYYEVPLYNLETDPVAQFCARMYTVALGRDYDKDGLEDWMMRLKLHMVDGAGIANGFLNSQEFLNKNHDNQAFLNILYHTFFDREPDSAGNQYWLDILLGDADRNYVIAGFVNSAEFTDLCNRFGIDRGTYSFVSMEKIREFVLRLYTKVLAREGEEAGVNDWTNKIADKAQTPEQVAMGFFGSQEFIRRNLSTEDFVDVLYRTFLDREADLNGKTDWTNRLQAGADKTEIIEGFTRSEEFQRIMRSYGL